MGDLCVGVWFENLAGHVLLGTSFIGCCGIFLSGQNIVMWLSGSVGSMPTKKTVNAIAAEYQKKLKYIRYLTAGPRQNSIIYVA